MSVSIVAVFLLLIVGLIGLVLVTLLVSLFAKAVGGNKKVGGGLAVVAITLALVVMFVVITLFTARVSYVDQRNRDFGGPPTVEVFPHQKQPTHNEYKQKQFLAGAEGEEIQIAVAESATSTVNVEGDLKAVGAVESPPIRHYEDPPVPASAPQAGGQPSTGITIAGNPWTDAVEEFQDFQADVYPSLEVAAEALGRRVGSRLMAQGDGNDAAPKSIYVWREGYEGSVSSHTVSDSDLLISRTVLDAVASGIRQKLDDPAYVSVEQAPTEDRRQNTLVKVVTQDFEFNHHNRWNQQAESRSGAIALRVETAGEPFAVSTRFVDALWVEDRSGFAQAYPNGDWMVGYSLGTHTSHDAARQDAVLAASYALLPLAEARINRLSASDQHRFAQQMAKDPDWLRNKVADELVSRNMATDRFAQRFDRPYGTVWREAVLVDASPQRVEQIARSLVQGLGSKVAYQRATWASFAALLALVFGTYLFLNFATKGYYTWTLRAFTAAGAAILLLVILNYA